MDHAVPIHVVSPSSDRRHRIAKCFGDGEPVEHEDLTAIAGAVSNGDAGAAGVLSNGHAPEDRRTIVADLEGGVDTNALLELCREIADRDLKWTVYVPGETDGEVTVRPLALGFPLSPVGLPLAEDGAGDAWPPFDLHEILRFIARIRHDINNPLTAGMAETQLLLMDLGSEGEVGESLETIQRQLKRIEGLVQDMGALRRPRPSAQGTEPAGR